MTLIKNSNQINLKLPLKLVTLAEEYVDYYGYSNVQELIRESLREKVFSENVKDEYVEMLLTDIDALTGIGEDKSIKGLLELGKRAKEFKNAEKRNL